MVGLAIVRRLESDSFSRLITRTHTELDLTDQERPGILILAAAKVGGILANNTCPAEFSYESLLMGANVIHQA